MQNCPENLRTEPCVGMLPIATTLHWHTLCSRRSPEAGARHPTSKPLGPVPQAAVEQATLHPPRPPLGRTPSGQRGAPAAPSVPPRRAAPPQVWAGPAPRSGRSPEAPRLWRRRCYGGCGAAGLVSSAAVPSRPSRAARGRRAALAARRRAALHVLPAGKRRGGIVGSSGTSRARGARGCRGPPRETECRRCEPGAGPLLCRALRPPAPGLRGGTGTPRWGNGFSHVGIFLCFGVVRL